jgi:hypothetical protein
MIRRFDELGIGIDKVLQLMIRKNGELQYKECDPSLFLEEEGL